MRYQRNKRYLKNNRDFANIGVITTWMALYALVIYAVCAFFTYGNTLHFPKHVPLSNFPTRGGGSKAICPALSTAKFRSAVGAYYDQMNTVDIDKYHIQVYCSIGEISLAEQEIDNWRHGLDGYASYNAMPVVLGDIYTVHTHVVVYPSGYSENTLTDIFVFNDGNFVYTIVSNATY